MHYVSGFTLDFQEIQPLGAKAPRLSPFFRAIPVVQPPSPGGERGRSLHARMVRLLFSTKARTVLGPTRRQVLRFGPAQLWSQLRPGLTPGYVTDLREYDADISAALTAMGRGPGSSQRNRRLILLGHSTGGLILSWWTHRHRGIAAALILNSPWLEFQGAEIGRRAIMPFVQLQARRHPLAPLPVIDPGIYSRAISSQFNGEWEYNALWRPYRGFPVTSAFFNAVLEA